MTPINNNNEGRAYIAGWIIKLLAAAFITMALAWGQHVTAVTTELVTEVAVQKQVMQTFIKTMDRMENKIDILVENKEDKQYGAK